MRGYQTITSPDPDMEREPTPATTIVDTGDMRRITLHKGAYFPLDLGTFGVLNDADDVQHSIGIHADLIAEIELGPKYRVFMFDRGEGSQGTETPIFPGSKFTVSDRYLLADITFLTRANIAHGLSKDVQSRTGLVELCNGASIDLGRPLSEDVTDYAFNEDAIPQTVSRRHASVSIDFGGTIYVADNNSANLTHINHQLPQ